MNLQIVFYLQKKTAETLYLPVLNIRENELHLRTDTTFFLSKLKIPCDLLTFRDQVDLLKIKEDKKLSVILVDYNVMTGRDAVLDDCVVSVLDHHERERPESDRYRIYSFFGYKTVFPHL